MGRTLMFSLSVSSLPLRSCSCNRAQLLTRARRRGRDTGFCVRATTDGDGFAELAKWVDFHGGLVHQSLTAGYSPLTGGRGVISKWDLSAEDVLDVPLMLIPEELCMSQSAAVQILDPLVEPLGLPSIQTLSSEMQVALVLAHEKGKGQESMWFPYIEMLPREPPCGFLWSGATVEDYFSTLPVDVERLMGVYSKARQSRLSDCNDKVDNALDKFGEVLGVSKDQLMWSLCQVSSRAFVEDGDDGVRLKPVIDLLNHSHKALPPRVVSGEVTFVETVDPLPAGNELFIDYVFDPNSSPLKEFLLFGFIPEEVLSGGS